MMPNSQIPGYFCSDAMVQHWCTQQLWDFELNPFRPPLSGREMFKEARRRFGDMACWDLEFWMH